MRIPATVALVVLTAATLSVAALTADTARAEDLRSDEGVSIPLPEGWSRRTVKLGATTVLAIERLASDGASEPRATIFVNSVATLAANDEKAFQQAREYLPKAGEVLDRAGGKVLRVDDDSAKDRPGAPLARYYVALREKRLYYFILKTTAQDFEHDAAAIDAVLDGARFFTPVPKPVVAPKPIEPKRVEPRPAEPRPAEPRNTTPPTPVKPGAETPLAEPRVDPKAGTPKAEPPKSEPQKSEPPKSEPPKSEPPKAEPPKTDPPKPDEPFAQHGPTPKKGPGEALVRSNPSEETRLDAKPDGAAVASPAVVKPVAVRSVGKTNVLGPKSLASSDGELESDGRLAQNLVDPAATKPWCSSPSGTTGRSKRLVFELARTMDVARVTFDAGCPDEAGFEGSGAREVVVQGSATGASGPWRELGRITLEKGKNDQALDLPPNEIRWLRAEVLSNHGHPTLTQLMKVRAYPGELVQQAPPAPGAAKPTSTDEGPFRVERLRLSHEKNGAPLPEPIALEAGVTVWVYFKPKALRLDEKGEYALEVDLRLEDGEGHEKLSTPKVVDHHARPPRAPLSPFVSLKVELPVDFPPGKYAVALDVRDKTAGTELKERVPFEVKKPR